jgi:type I restriction enzyme R subunit
VQELAVPKLPQLLKMKYGSPNDAVKVLGKPEDLNKLFVGFQKLLYQKAYRFGPRQ